VPAAPAVPAGGRVLASSGRLDGGRSIPANVFFARQVTTTRTSPSGGAINKRSFHIYSEVVDP